VALFIGALPANRAITEKRNDPETACGAFRARVREAGTPEVGMSGPDACWKTIEGNRRPAADVAHVGHEGEKAGVIVTPQTASIFTMTGWMMGDIKSAQT
jgi:hypothetical protein